MNKTHPDRHYIIVEPPTTTPNKIIRLANEYVSSFCVNAAFTNATVSVRYEDGLDNDLYHNIALMINNYKLMLLPEGVGASVGTTLVSEIHKLGLGIQSEDNAILYYVRMSLKNASLNFTDNFNDAPLANLVNMFKIGIGKHKIYSKYLNIENCDSDTIDLNANSLFVHEKLISMQDCVNIAIVILNTFMKKMLEILLYEISTMHANVKMHDITSPVSRSILSSMETRLENAVDRDCGIPEAFLSHKYSRPLEHFPIFEELRKISDAISDIERCGDWEYRIMYEWFDKGIRGILGLPIQQYLMDTSEIKMYNKDIIMRLKAKNMHLTNHPVIITREGDEVIVTEQHTQFIIEGVSKISGKKVFCYLTYGNDGVYSATRDGYMPIHLALICTLVHNDDKHEILINKMIAFYKGSPVLSPKRRYCSVSIKHGCLVIYEERYPVKIEGHTNSLTVYARSIEDSCVDGNSTNKIIKKSSDTPVNDILFKPPYEVNKSNKDFYKNAIRDGFSVKMLFASSMHSRLHLPLHAIR